MLEPNLTKISVNQLVQHWYWNQYELIRKQVAVEKPLPEPIQTVYQWLVKKGMRARQQPVETDYSFFDLKTGTLAKQLTGLKGRDAQNCRIDAQANYLVARHTEQLGPQGFRDWLEVYPIKSYLREQVLTAIRNYSSLLVIIWPMRYLIRPRVKTLSPT